MAISQRILIIISMSLLLSSCTTNKFSEPYADTYEKYQAKYKGTQVDEAAVNKFSTLFAQLENNGTLEQRIRNLYANDLYFNDTFNTFTNLDALVNYLIHTAEQGVGVDVKIDDIAQNNNDYYIRWTMSLEFSDTETLKSIGITHLRFNEDQKVVLHQDYWDGVEGFYQTIPVVGYLLKQVRNRL